MPSLASEKAVRNAVRCRWRCNSATLLCLIALGVFAPGCGRREIVRPTPQMDIGSPFWVRVLLQGNITECTVSVPSAARMIRSEFGPGTPATESLRTATRVGLAGGRLELGGTSLPGREVTISPERPHIFNLNGSDYRGKLKLVINEDGRTFDAINLIPLEPYLAGVVGAEMPDYWEPEALKAQAIAARSYCMYIKNRFGANRRWDVSRTQASQVYGGLKAESAQTWNAVSSTHGKVLTSKSPNALPLPGRSSATPGLFPAYYSAVCGGHTEDSAHVFGDSFEPLQGVPCPYCKDTARLGLFFWPMAQFDRATVTERLVQKYPGLEALGSIEDIKVIEESKYGTFSRLVKIQLTGSTGKTDVLRGEDLRLTIDSSGRKIRSTTCHIVEWGNGWAFLSGRGWGHSVGLCQYGAEGMARLGKSTQEILQHYYPGSVIVSIY